MNGAPGSRSPARWLSLALIVAGLAGSSYRIATHPDDSWDLFPYVAIALSYWHDDWTEVHRLTFETAREQTDLLERPWGRYGRGTRDNPDFFAQQIPFYSVKPAFPALVAALHAFGLEIVPAGRMLNLACYWALGFVLFAWMRRSAPPPLDALLALGLLLLPELVRVARTFTPDMLSVTVVIAGLYLLLERERALAATGLLAAAVVVRPDNMAILGVAVVDTALVRRVRPGPVLLLGACGAALFLVETWASGYYGWQTLFYHSHVHALLEPAEFATPLSLSDVLAVYAEALPTVFMHDALGLFGLLLLLAVLLRLSLRGPRDACLHLLVGMVPVIGWHLLVHPIEVARILAGVYMFVLTALAASAGLSLRERRER